MDDIIGKCGEIFSDTKNRLLFQCLLCEGNIYREILEYLVHISQAHQSFQLNCKEKYLNVLEAAGTQSLMENIKTENVDDVPFGDVEANKLTRNHDKRPCGIESVRNQNENLEDKKGLYQCANCNEDFTESRLLLNHIKECCNIKGQMKELLKDSSIFDPDDPFYCKKCQQEFSDVYLLKTHVFRQHSELKYFKCSQCKVSFHEVHALVGHMRSTHVDIEALQREREGTSENEHEDEPLAPTTPSRVLNREDGDENLKETHRRISVKKNYECHDCHRKFRYAAVLEFHRNKMHSQQKIEPSPAVENSSGTEIDIKVSPAKEQYYHLDESWSINTKCVLCDLVLARTSLRNHMLRHENKKEHECSLCSKRFITRFALKRHMDSHDPEKKYMCPVCDMAISDPCNLRHHIRRHSEQNKTISCSFCPKKFFTSTERNTHQRIHTKEKLFLCAHCGRSFYTSGHLQTHMRRHRNEKNHKCKFCNKAFYEKTQLNIHMRSHLEARDFKCSECEATFKRQHCLSQHRKIHENMRTYKCHLCNASFNQGPGLASHMKSKHRSVKE